MLTLIPAHGRDYKSADAAIADFNADKDFIAVGYLVGQHDRPANKSALLKAGEVRVRIRYNKLTRVARVDVVASAPAKASDTTNLTELNEFFPPSLAARKPQPVVALQHGETVAQGTARVARVKAAIAAQQAQQDSTGKWYIWLNAARAETLYWAGRTWTADPKAAMLYPHRDAAEMARDRSAQRTAKGEAIVSQATKNIFA